MSKGTTHFQGSPLMKRIAVVVVTAVVCAFVAVPLAMATFNSDSVANSGVSQTVALGITSNQSDSTASVAADASKKLVVSGKANDRAGALSQMTATTDRSGVVYYAQEQQAQEAAAQAQAQTGNENKSEKADDAVAAATNPLGWPYGKSTGDYSTHSGGISFFETGGTYGVAVDIALLNEYPMGTVLELTYNGKTVNATVCDCGDWWSAYGNSYIMFDVMPGTCDQLGWTKDKRYFEGITTISWRVVSYG